jgi:hypothetical protein
LDNGIWLRLTTLLTELYALVLKALAIGYCILSGLDMKWLYSMLHQEPSKDPTRSDDRYKGFLVVVRMAGSTIANSIRNHHSNIPSFHHSGTNQKSKPPKKDLYIQ